jgi:predicted phosphodiesterase
MTIRVAIFSDVHGNLAGLQAVLADIKALERPADQVIFAGDLCLFGPRPAECLRAVMAADIGTLYGNTDRWITAPPTLPAETSTEAREKYDRRLAMIEWTAAQLRAGELALFDGMPFMRRVSPDPNPRDDLLIVHANPYDVDQVIYPPVDWQESLFGSVRQSDEELVALLGDTIMGALAFGHLHVPSVRYLDGVMLVNVSSVSLPGDGDQRAKYAVLTWDEESGWSAEHHYVEYPIADEIAAWEERQPPGWQEAVTELRQNGALPQRL